MKAKYQILLWAAITLFVINSVIFAQQANQKTQYVGTIQGIIVDSVTKMPISYSTITILSAVDSMPIAGTISKKEGEFTVENVPNGKFTAKISYLGYARLFVDNIVISASQPNVNIGRHALNPAEINTNEVEVTADREIISYNQEKKIIDVSKMVDAKTGNATDLLRNLPSVQVDMEGNVSLRGSQSFQLLIDGKPSLMNKTDLLRQLPAEAIQSIEIITNPSAKYDPEGNSGIMNIVTKRETFAGFDGIANASASRYDRYYGNILINYKNEEITHTLGIDYNNTDYFSTSTLMKTVYMPNINDSVFTNTQRMVKPEGITAQYEFKYDFNKEKALTLHIDYSPSNFNMNMDHFYKYMGNGSPNFSVTKTNYSNDYNNFDAFLDYSDINPQTLDGISTNIIYAYWSGITDIFLAEYITDSDYNNLPDIDNLQTKNYSDAFVHFLKGKIDYTTTFENLSKIELGANSEYYYMENDQSLKKISHQTNEWIIDNNFTNQMEFYHFTNSAYATYSDKLSIFDYKFGVRGESYQRNLRQIVGDKSFKNDFLSIFPTVHISTQIDDYKAVSISYSRRITRPEPQNLNPMPDFNDDQMISMGNPELKPMYSDVFELSLSDVNMFGFLYFSANFFANKINDVINRSFRLMDDGRLLIRPVNNGTDKAVGTELTFSFAPFKWWKFSAVGSLSYKEVRGSEGLYAKRNFNAYDIRLFSNFIITNTTFFSVNSIFNGKNYQPDGETEPYMIVSAGIRQSLFDNKLTLAFNYQDLFGYTYKFKNYSKEYDTYGEFFSQSQVLSLSLSYRINDYKPTQKINEDTRINFNGASGGI